MSTETTQTNANNETATERFYDEPNPRNAVALAIADHEGYNKGRGQIEFTHQLRRAISQLDERDELLAALRHVYAWSKVKTGALDPSSPLFDRATFDRFKNVWSDTGATLRKVQS